MERQLIKDGEICNYTLRKGLRFRRIRIVVKPNGDVTVTSPYLISERKIEEFLLDKFSWIQEKVEYYKKHPQVMRKKHSAQEIKEYKKQAGVLARLRLEHWNKLYNFNYNKVTIKNMTSRWGSCSSKGNLNFNYKIALLPEELVDYVIVHELCHLEEMNHGKNFWNLVAKTFPHYKETRHQLKKVS